MANASAKRVASQNSTTVKNLRLGMLVSGVLSLLFRLIIRRGALSPKSFAFWIYVVSLVPSIFLSRYLERIGSPQYDSSTGTLISAGEDLSRPGVLEWCFDVVYITWACQVGSGAFGQWFWWFYLVIPAYAMFKLWNSVISPYVLGRGSGPAAVEAEAPANEPTSKRQEKLRKRQEKGDPRVQSRTIKRQA